MAKYEEEKMKKRILCLLLCMVMMVGVLASCGAKEDSEAVEDINEKASESAITLAMYLMSETEVSAEQEKAIEDAVNKITNADKIKLELFYYTPDKYYEALEKAFADRKAAEEQGLITKPNKDESVEDQTYEDDWGIWADTQSLLSTLRWVCSRIGTPSLRALPSLTTITYSLST